MDPVIEGRLDWRVTIPQARTVESLNVAAAAAICLFEQRRQRGALDA
jgi:TrmH family RNA methyltransferase